MGLLFPIPQTFVVVCILFLLSAILASYFSALRASRINQSHDRSKRRMLVADKPVRRIETQSVTDRFAFKIRKYPLVTELLLKAC